MYVLLLCATRYIDIPILGQNSWIGNGFPGRDCFPPGEIRPGSGDLPILGKGVPPLVYPDVCKIIAILFCIVNYFAYIAEVLKRNTG